MKIKSKTYFKMNYSFMKRSYQKFEVLTQLGDVINPKWLYKGAKFVFDVLMVIER